MSILKSIIGAIAITLVVIGIAMFCIAIAPFVWLANIYCWAGPMRKSRSTTPGMYP